MSVGENIKKYRKLKGLKQSELAELANISRVAIGNYERNDRTPTVDILSNIANALNVDINLLIDNNKIKQTDNMQDIPDEDIHIIQRAKSKMSKEQQDKMMEFLKIAFTEYFDDED